MTVRLKPKALERVVERARLSPSPMNTQPARWHLDAEGTVWILADPSRRLSIADPRGFDMRLACGAALEATVLALSELGLGVARTQHFDRGAPASPVPGLEPVARLHLGESTAPHPLAPLMDRRFTWHDGFARANPDQARDLFDWARLHEGLVLVLDRAEIGRLAERNDGALLRLLGEPDYRAEFRRWLRLGAPDEPLVDGIPASALGLSRLGTRLARLALSPRAAPLADALRLTERLFAESQRSETATAILLFARPSLESPLAAGRAWLYRLLELADLGFQAWPMPALLAQPEAASEIRRNAGIHDGNRLISLFRIGVPPRGRTPPRLRLPVARLIV
ncbi:hypothetical protein SAMN02983003_3934 [Devosia enhydra]|uniref:Nitroreductase family protein n=1 Tax=Devosia enhydra TaxID=665118 RepID=A0A1K2I4T4_9HYPH|nr:hypothetical protein [Devosia enhydra]SFZ86740.1 hypothetical protein SAMN02983003_3934 [Devosia enhydra]